MPDEQPKFHTEECYAMALVIRFNQLENSQFFWINTNGLQGLTKRHNDLNAKARWVKAAFHWQWSWRHSRSSKSASDLPVLKIENWSCKRRLVPFPTDSAYDSSTYDLVKTMYIVRVASRSVRTNQSQCQFSGILIGLFFGFRLRLQQSSFH